MEQRIIIHLDMDCFFAQVEERESPQFRGKPVVVGADPKEGRGRGVVSTANYDARKYGIHSGLPISKAWQLCPTAVFVQPNFELYSRTSENIMNIIRQVVADPPATSRKLGLGGVAGSPAILKQDHACDGGWVEQMSLDEAYIDISKNFTIVNKTSEKDKWKEAEKIAEEMRKEILKKEKLVCSCGVGPNKLIAKIACQEAKPNGIKVVTEKQAEAFIEPLDVEKMPGIGKKTAAILRQSNFHTVADLKKLSEHDLQDLFGIRGKEMYNRVRGIDTNKVEPERDAKSVGKEITFSEDTRDPELLMRTFEELVKEVGQEIQEQGVSYKTVTVVCRFSGFETHTKSKTLAKPISSYAVFRVEAIKLFLRFLVEKQKPIRLIGVRGKIAADLYL